MCFIGGEQGYINLGEWEGFLVFFCFVCLFFRVNVHWLGIKTLKNASFSWRGYSRYLLARFLFERRELNTQFHQGLGDIPQVGDMGVRLPR